MARARTSPWKIRLLLALALVGAGRPAWCIVPWIPKSEIPREAPWEVAEKIQRLYSTLTAERALAARALGEAGPEAAAAIPFLVGLLRDDFATHLPGQRAATTPGKEALRALERIDPRWKEAEATHRAAADLLVRAALLRRDTAEVNQWLEPLGASCRDSPAANLAVPGLAALLDSPEGEATRADGGFATSVALAAMKLIACNRSRDAVDALVSFWRRTPDKSLRGEAAAWLNGMAPGWSKAEVAARPTADWVADLRSSDQEVVRRAVDALLEIRDPSTLEDLLAAVRRQYEGYRLIVFGQLVGDWKGVDLGAQITPDLIASLKNKDFQTSAQAANLLGKLRPPGALPALVNGTASGEFSVPWLLGDYGEAAVGPLLEALRGASGSPRLSLVLSLALTGDSRAVELLIGEVRAGAGAKEPAVFRCLEKLTGQRFGSNANDWLAWWEGRGRAAKP